MEELNIFWFRRDLRLYDNSGLSEATNGKLKVIPLFIFDTSITDKLPLCLLYTSPSPRDAHESRMPSSA